jgi:pimeloyl-ACP methyl ester carboxylesterase
MRILPVPVRQLAAAVAVAALLASGCSPSPSSPAPSATLAATATVAASAPTLVDAPCPDDIELRALVQHSCAYLTVPEDRSNPTGRTIRLLMVRTPPPVGTPRDWPATAFGGDLGTSFAGVSSDGATRTRAVQYQLDPRGLRRSDPDLECPEIDALDIPVAEAKSGDPDIQSQLIAAVAGCRQRLQRMGIDVAAYDVANTAADLEDLRVALGLDKSLIDTKGDASLYTLEYLRHWSAHVGRVVLDSPRFPQERDSAGGLAGLEYAWGRFVAECGADAPCAKLLPDPISTLRAAVARLDSHPAVVQVVTGPLAASANRPVALLVDGQRLLRAVRFALGGDGPDTARLLPSIIERASHGEVNQALAQILGGHSTLCVGYRPECGQPGSLTWGVYLTVLCRDIVPFDSPPKPADLTADPVGFAGLFRGDLLHSSCPAWNVPPAEASTVAPPSVTTPMLVYSGEMDSWSTRPQIEAALSSLPNAHYFELVGQTHNVMGFTNCSVEMRNAWLDDPMSPPPDTSCLASLHPTFEIDAAGG